MPIDRTVILRNAEKLLRQGKLDQAIGEYLRIVEDQPSDWNTANVLGDLYVRARQTERAVEQFVRIADHLHTEGFLPKAAAVYKKVLKLKPGHEHAMLQAGEIAARQGLAADARSLFNTIAEQRRARRDERGVAEIVVRLAALDPNDFEARLNGARTRVTLDDVAGAIADLKALAVYMQEKERSDERLQALREASALDPQDADLRAQLAEILVAEGGLPGANELAPASAAAEPLLAIAAERLRGGNHVEGLEILRRLVDQDANRRDEVALLGWSIAESEAAVGLDVVRLAANAAVAAGDHASAAAALQEYVTRVPSHIPALALLVEICAGGGLEATLHSARGQLADAYIAAGQGDDARAIAEDLVAREPWEQANVERFRRALVLIGDEDPDEVIARRLSGQTPFTSTDWARIEISSIAASAAPPTDAVTEAPVLDVEPPSTAAASHAGAVFDLEPTFDEVAVVPVATGRMGEVDLSVALDEIRRPATPEIVKPLERRDAGSSSSPDEDYRLGLTLYEAGRAEEAVAPLMAATTTPKLRFPTAALLGRICRDRGQTGDAIEWFERAAQAPAPTPEQGHLLLFELAEALESEGETARALAICMELQADAGNYRDVAARIDRLAKVRARG